MSDTPRTDHWVKSTKHLGRDGMDLYMDALELARELERELNEATAIIRQCEEEFGCWQPIETAPKDGTPILAWNAFADGSPSPHGMARVVYWDSYHTKSWTGSSCETTHLRATHWMPLPKPPTA